MPCAVFFFTELSIDDEIDIQKDFRENNHYLYGIRLGLIAAASEMYFPIDNGKDRAGILAWTPNKMDINEEGAAYKLEAVSQTELIFQYPVVTKKELEDMKKITKRMGKTCGRSAIVTFYNTMQNVTKTILFKFDPNQVCFRSPAEGSYFRSCSGDKTNGGCLLWGIGNFLPSTLDSTVEDDHQDILKSCYNMSLRANPPMETENKGHSTETSTLCEKDSVTSEVAQPSRLTISSGHNGEDVEELSSEIVTHIDIPCKDSTKLSHQYLSPARLVRSHLTMHRFPYALIMIAFLAIFGPSTYIAQDRKAQLKRFIQTQMNQKFETFPGGDLGKKDPREIVMNWLSVGPVADIENCESPSSLLD